ncbi:PH domain-containing protein [Streptomyces sp. MUM 203J]|uniref:PH domain-containing protein n=1 Tax=Streptomyces sp. MUM 203J TaxID=2791990 RepID=UPI001F04097A|nr:PH domain-containing protein [Streptomyces sp. MUM 203J]MCH0539635.1 PH domain-containing protein [Streptomyces sp. MUM 203J]
MTGENTVQETRQVRLRPPGNSLDERAVTWWRTQWLLTTAVLGAALAVPGWLFEPARPWLTAAAGAVAVAGLVCSVLLPRWWFRIHRWEVTDDAVYVRTGYFWQEWRIAPMSRIQTVDTVRGPLEQAFRLATVTVTTASAKGALTIAGLDHELAADLAQRLTRITQATPGDAT